jgi:hypothetical protein
MAELVNLVGALVVVLELAIAIQTAVLVVMV